MGIAVFHRIGNEANFVNPIEQILAYDGIITFDGAYESVYHHRKELASRKPILFIQGDTVGTDGVCKWWQIMELVYRWGFQLGWHGHSHRKLTELNAGEVYKEIRPDGPLWPSEYKYYAYPHGDWDNKVAAIVRQAGYEKAYSTTQGEEGNDFAIIREYL